MKANGDEPTAPDTPGPVPAGDQDSLARNGVFEEPPRSTVRLREPAWAWVRQEGGTNCESGSQVEVDSDGCVYVLGGFERPGTNAPAGSSEWPYFLARYDSRGNLLWVRSSTGSGRVAPWRFHLAAAGNAYLLGTFNGEVDFDGNRISSTRHAAFIMKYDQRGRALWATQADVLEAEDSVLASTVDRQGNVYVAGDFSRAIRIGHHILSPAGGNSDVLVAKFNHQGEVLWARQSGTAEPDWPHALAVDSRGNVYLAGTIQTWEARIPGGAFDFIPHTFLTRQDAHGNAAWTICSEGGQGDSHGYAVATDAAGNAFLAGSFSGGFSLSGQNLARETGEGSYIAKIRPTGELLWLRSAGATESDHVAGLAVDMNGSLYATGDFHGNATFGHIRLNSDLSFEAFVVKYGVAGDPLWARQMRSQYFSQALQLQLDGHARVYLFGEGVGMVSADAEVVQPTHDGYPHLFMVSFDADGYPNWLQNLDGDTLRMWSTFAVDHAGNCYLTGSFDDTLVFGNQTLISRGSRDFFLAKFASGVNTPRN